MIGYYVETGYIVLQLFSDAQDQLIPFVRFEQLDTHLTTGGGLIDNPAYNISAINTGIGWKPTPGTVVKADVQFLKSEADAEFSKTLNLGIGVWF